MMGLTAKQKQCLEVIRTFLQDGKTPSLEEIAAGMGTKSKGAVSKMIDNLEARGAVRRIKGRYRSLEILEPGKLRAVLLNDEIHQLLSVYAQSQHIGLDTAACDLLRSVLL